MSAIASAKRNKPSSSLIGSFIRDPIKALEKEYLHHTDPMIRCILLLQTLRDLYKEAEEEKKETIPIKTLVKPLIHYFIAPSKHVIKTIHSLFHSTHDEIIQTIDRLLSRIETAQRQIIDTTVKMIKEKKHKIILVFGYSPLIRTITASLDSEYKLYQCDDSHHRLSEKSLSDGPSMVYLQLNALSYVMSEVDMVLLGCNEIMGNGDMKAPVGTALVSMVAHHHHVPVFVCCETISLTKRVEIGVDIKEVTDKAYCKIGTLAYDITPSRFISQIITEKGILHPSSVNCLLR